MVKYDGYDITFQEVPNEVSLVFNITNCQGTCEGCHSPWLRGDYGRPLHGDLESLIQKYKGLITCVCFMGEGNDVESLVSCVQIVRNAGLKTCIYSGRDENTWALYHTDYFKFGSYQPDKGGLDKADTTNQKFLFYSDPTGETPPKDITSLFKKKGK